MFILSGDLSRVCDCSHPGELIWYLGSEVPINLFHHNHPLEHSASGFTCLPAVLHDRFPNLRYSSVEHSVCILPRSDSMEPHLEGEK